MKKFLALILALSLLASLGIGAVSASADQNVVNIGVTGTLGSVNPLVADQTEFSKVAIDLQYLPLCELNSELEFVGMLSDSITTEDNLHFTVHIDENAFWSDGEPVTADDVVFTVLKLTSPVIANSTTLLYAFEGTDDETGFTAEGAAAEDLTGVAKLDEKTVLFTAKYPMPLTTFENTYGRYIHTLPAHELSSYTDEELMTTRYFDSPAVVSGPYRLTAYDTDHYVTYARNESYWKGEAQIPVLNLIVVEASQLYAAIASGEIDFVQQTLASIPFDDYANIEALDGVTATIGKMITNQSLFIQTQNITDVRIRQAILCGIDRETIVEGFIGGYGEVVDGFLSSASPFYDDTLSATPYDPERAAALVKEAAADGCDTSEAIEFYTWSGDGAMTNVAAFMVSELKEIGLNVRIHTVDLATLMSVAGSEDVDMFAVQYTYCPVDPYPDVDWLLSGDGSWTGYYNEAVSAALADSQATSDLEQTRADYRIVDEAMQEDAAMISIYVLGAMGVCSDRLQNAAPDVYGSFINVNEWTLAY